MVNLLIALKGKKSNNIHKAWGFPHQPNCIERRLRNPQSTAINKKALTENLSLDLIPDPFIILQADGTIFDINTSCSALVGIPKADLIGLDFTCFELYRKLSERVSWTDLMKTENFKRIRFKDHHFEVLILPFTTESGLDLIRVVLKDITGFVRLEKELLKRNKELIIISTLSNSFIFSENMELALDDLLEKVLLITDFTSGWLMLRENDRFKVKAGRGISQEFKKSIEENELEPLCNKVADQGEPLYFADTSDISGIRLFQKEGISFLTALPLISTQKTIGMLFLGSSDRSSEGIDFDVAALLSLIGNHVSLIIDKIRLFQETERLSITDSLTNLYNRRHFYKHLAIETARSRRYESAFSLMLFDIDNFKAINDTYGHQVGDEVLQKLSDILRQVCRETDIIVRYGGEEFIIILPNTSEEETVSLANRIKHSVQETVFYSDSEKITFTLSGGIASYPKNATTAKALLNAADTALYEAKASGKNRILCHAGRIDEKNIQQTAEP